MNYWVHFLMKQKRNTAPIWNVGVWECSQRDQAILFIHHFLTSLITQPHPLPRIWSVVYLQSGQSQLHQSYSVKSTSYSTYWLLTTENTAHFLSTFYIYFTLHALCKLSIHTLHFTFYLDFLYTLHSNSVNTLYTYSTLHYVYSNLHNVHKHRN